MELLIVIGIMGLLGTVSVSGFRGLRKGIEERGTMEVVDKFVHAAYRRSVIDRVPVDVYFWNETISDESDAHGGKLVVVGHAVAVRRGGRFTKIVTGRLLVDEFGDLADEVKTDENGLEITGSGDAQDDPGRYLYKVPNTSFQRDLVSSMTVRDDSLNDTMVSLPSQTVEIRGYGYLIKKSEISWEVGDPYGFAVAELTLPKNFIFGTSYSDSVDSPEKEAHVINYDGTGARTGGDVTVSGLQLDKSGAVAFKSLGQSKDPTKDW